MNKNQLGVKEVIASLVAIGTFAGGLVTGAELMPAMPVIASSAFIAEDNSLNGKETSLPQLLPKR